MTQPPDPSSPASDARAEQALDLALRRALAPPGAPPELRWRLMAAMQQDGLRDLAAQRAALEAEHARQAQQVRAGYLRLRRETLMWGVGLAFAAGALATRALPWLVAATGWDAGLLMPSLATLAGGATGLAVWWWRLSEPGP